MLLQHLITFCKVVETGSFTRAAGLLNLSQPSVTKHVSSLEGHLGAQLLDRDGKRVHLTPSGEVVYEYAKRVQQSVSECQAAVQTLKHPESGAAVIGCVHTVGLYMLPDLLAEFSRVHPLVRLLVKTARMQDTLSLLLQHEVDIGLVTAPVSHERVTCIPLYEDPVVVVSAPEPRFPLPDTLDMEDLARLPVIGFQRGTRFRGFLDSVLDQYDVHVQPVMEFDNHETIKAMAALGLGLAMVPASAVHTDLAAGRLVQRPVPNLGPISRTTSLLLLTDRRLAPAPANLVHFLLARFGVQETQAAPTEE